MAFCRECDSGGDWVCGPCADDIDRRWADTVDRLVKNRRDLRGVVIVEVLAAWSGALPFGWERSFSRKVPYDVEVRFGAGLWLGTGLGWSRAEASGKAWAAEYAARPRIEE